MRFCKDCKYIEEHPGASTPRCGHKGSIRTSFLVDGNMSIDYRKDAYDMRSKDGPCGYEGKLYEPKSR